MEKYLVSWLEKSIDLHWENKNWTFRGLQSHFLYRWQINRHFYLIQRSRNSYDANTKTKTSFEVLWKYDGNIWVYPKYVSGTVQVLIHVQSHYRVYNDFVHVDKNG